MEPWQSWALAVTAGGAITYYYAKDTKFVKNLAGSSAPNTEQSQPGTAKRRTEKPASKRKGESGQGASSSASPQDSTSSRVGVASPAPAQANKRKGSRPQSARPVIHQNGQVRELPDDVNQADDDKEWAKQLEARRKGVNLQKESASKAKPRTQKPNSYAEAAAPSEPDVEREITSTPAGGDVSDMLEATASGPTSLRITGEEKEKKQYSQRPEPAKETKKQRQNRKKAEERRAVREEEEKERKVMLEQQRRTAREARGEAAKNGIPYAAAPTANAWAAPPHSSNQPATAGPVKDLTAPKMNEATLLDTFEHETLSSSSSNENRTNATTPATAASIDQDIPSEEVQMEMLRAMNGDNGWNEVSVKSKKGKKKVTETADAASESTPVTAPNAAPKQPAQPETVKPSRNTATAPTNGFSVLNDFGTAIPPAKGHPEDSDWAVY